VFGILNLFAFLKGAITMFNDVFSTRETKAINSLSVDELVSIRDYWSAKYDAIFDGLDEEQAESLFCYQYSNEGPAWIACRMMRLLSDIITRRMYC
jgi:hypothetical protein